MDLQEFFKQMEGDSKKSNRRADSKSNGSKYLVHERFIAAIRSANALFDNQDHHDSHEFLSWLIDTIHENVVNDNKLRYQNKKDQMSEAEYTKKVNTTFVSQIFQGYEMSLTTCLCCE